ncbi:serine carboxypeptidase-like 17 [Abrus precatorius]|uniref:Serine carboxypeptidase-like 17 n=1 Tax=Abrus precatorius TaxID=3816 RepID=A0A8B8KQV6_ABRPR|nr:serine carboxypeptidase-like 17 [Abrus precatorius]
MVNIWKSWCVLVTAVHLFHITSSNFSVKNLPGFGDLPFTLNTGYIGVGEREQVQLFYYFIESQRSPLNDPLLLWLVGGPGCSAHSAFFYENGPLMFNYDAFNGSFPELILNQNTWTKVLNILYVDAPVGTGYSYSKTQEGYYSNDIQLVEHIYEFLQKWMADHVRFRSNPLYIGGGSYSGMVVVPLVQKVYEGNYYILSFTICDSNNNILGFVLSSPRIDSFMDNNTKVEFAYQRALISNELYESIKSGCNGDYINRDPNNTKCISDYEAFSELVRYINEFQILEPSCMIGSKENQRILSEEFKNIHQTKFRCRDDQYAVGELWANDPLVRKALHVREGTKEYFQRCNRSDAYTKNVPSVVEHLRNLTNTNLRSLIYCGDLDLSTPYLSSLSIVKSLKLKLDKTWHPWFVDGEVAGYSESYQKSDYHLTYTIVKGGCHVVQENKPKEVFEMIDRWLSFYDI